MCGEERWVARPLGSCSTGKGQGLGSCPLWAPETKPNLTAFPGGAARGDHGPQVQWGKGRKPGRKQLWR